MDRFLKGFCLRFSVEFYTSCESDVEHSKTKSITMPRHNDQVNFDNPHKTKLIDPHAKNQSFSARTLKPS